MVPDAPAASTAEPPDLLFALIGGLYLGVMAGTLAVAATRRGAFGPGAVYALLVAVVTVVTVVGTVAIRSVPGLAVRLGRGRLGWAVPAVPVGFVLVGFGLDALGVLSLDEGDAVLALFGGSAAVLVGLVLVSMAVTRWARATLSTAEVHATWRAAWPQRERRLLVGGGGALLVGGFVVLIAGAALQQDVVRLLGQVGVLAGVLVAMVGQERTYRATDRGLEIRLPGARRLVPWSAIGDVRVTGEAVVLRRTRPLSLGWRFDRESLADAEAVVAALEEYVDRQ